MIDPKDLRIGNFILADRGQIIKVAQIRRYPASTRYLIDSEYGATASATNDCNPIPLTPGVLEACGIELYDVMQDVNGPSTIYIDSYSILTTEYPEHRAKHYFCVDVDTAEGHDDNYTATTRVIINGEEKTENKLCDSITSLHQLQNLFYHTQGIELVVKVERLSASLLE